MINLLLICQAASLKPTNISRFLNSTRIWVSSLKIKSPEMRNAHPLLYMLVSLYRKCVLKQIVLENSPL